MYITACIHFNMCVYTYMIMWVTCVILCTYVHYIRTVYVIAGVKICEQVGGSVIRYFIIYQCYVYRTNIRHIAPEVAWECDTTSVIRWVWYDAYVMGGKMLKSLFVKFWLWIFFFNILLYFILLFFFGNFVIFCLIFLFIFYFIYSVATTRHTEHCALLVAFDNSSRR